MTRHAAAVARVEELRHSLPTNLYLEQLHRIVMTGELINFDLKTGQPTGIEPVEPKERIRLAQYLVDKAMPNQAPIHVDTEDEADHATIAARPTQVSAEALQKLLDSAQLPPSTLPVPAQTHD